MRFMISSHKSGLFAIGFLILLPNLSNQSFAGIREAEVRAAVEARLSQLQNLSVSYHESVTSDYSAIMAARSGSNKSIQRPEVVENKGKFSFFHGLAKFEYSVKDIAAAQKSRQPIKTVFILSADRVESYYEYEPKVPGRGGIGSLRKWGWDIDTCLGLRKFLAYNWFDAAGLKAMNIETVNDNEYVFSRIDENSGGTDKWTYDRRYGYAMTKYAFVRNVDHLAIYNISNEDFRLVENVMLPFKMMLTIGPPINGKVAITQTTIYSVNDYTLNSNDNDASKYHMVWPADATIIDGATNILVRNGDQARILTDQDIADADTANKAAHQAQLQHTQDRIDRILGTTRPSTEPATRPGN